MSDVPGEMRDTTCTGCGEAMVRVVHIDAFGDMRALDAYECSRCGGVKYYTRRDQVPARS
jgi:hypothetical protein